MRAKTLVAILLPAVSVGLCTYLYAFDNIETHPSLTEKAVCASVLDNYLKAQMGLSVGIETQIKYDFPLLLILALSKTSIFSLHSNNQLLPAKLTN